MEKVIYKVNVIETQCNTHPEHPTLERGHFEYKGNRNADILEVLEGLRQVATRAEKWGDKTYRVVSLEIVDVDLDDK